MDFRIIISRTIKNVFNFQLINTSRLNLEHFSIKVFKGYNVYLSQVYIFGK